ncbi:MAG: Phosphoheptose isomerase, partial [uncultured Blastococcus sp.]
ETALVLRERGRGCAGTGHLHAPDRCRPRGLADHRTGLAEPAAGRTRPVGAAAGRRPGRGAARPAAGGGQRRQRGAGAAPHRRAGRPLPRRPAAVLRHLPDRRDVVADRDRQRLPGRRAVRPPGGGARPGRRRADPAVDLRPVTERRGRRPAGPRLRPHHPRPHRARTEPPGGRGRRRHLHRLPVDGDRAGVPPRRPAPGLRRLRRRGAGRAGPRAVRADPGDGPM